jgi:acetyltransferase-like isoleucine patch superfamily enzyme
MKQWLWRNLIDPVLLKAESRLLHLRGNRPITHNGARWAAVARIGEGALFYPEASVTSVNGPSSCVNERSVSVGDFSTLRGELLVMPGGRISIGRHCFLGEGSRVWSQASVRIGNTVLISHQVDIHDTNSHSMAWELRRAEARSLFELRKPYIESDVSGIDSAPIVIEDDVWIGFKSTILKGVTLGRGAVVAACSVVTHDVEPFTLVAGNPARVIRSLPNPE